MVVEELCSNTVATTPSMRPAIGLARMVEEDMASPAVFPPNNLNPEERNDREQMNMYSRKRRSTNLPIVNTTRLILPLTSSSKKQSNT